MNYFAVLLLFCATSYSQELKDYFVIPEKRLEMSRVFYRDEYPEPVEIRKISSSKNEDGSIEVNWADELNTWGMTFTVKDGMACLTKGFSKGEDYLQTYSSNKPCLHLSDEMVKKKEGSIKDKLIWSSVYKENGQPEKKETNENTFEMKWKHLEKFSVYKDVIVIDTTGTNNDVPYSEKQVFAKGIGQVYFETISKDFKEIIELYDTAKDEEIIVNFMKAVIKKIESGDKSSEGIDIEKYYESLNKISMGNQEDVQNFIMTMLMKRAPEIIKDLPKITQFFEMEKENAEKKLNHVTTTANIKDLTTAIYLYYKQNKKLPEKIEDVKNLVFDFESAIICKVNDKPIEYIRDINKLDDSNNDAKVLVLKAVVESGTFHGYLNGNVEFIENKK